ncbi:hypothetical protein ACIQOW_15650 [Kitasatospora sp. NPDC091335]|uniref:hypothetical protein n=1 Tax=Kitasatospora sp. NPDC091335 TaxID=3364085 RepID=UPI00382B4547
MVIAGSIAPRAAVRHTVPLPGRGGSRAAGDRVENKPAAAGDPSRIHDLAAVRVKFADSWVPVNMLRTALCTGGLLALTRSLVLHGRAER